MLLALLAALASGVAYAAPAAAATRHFTCTQTTSSRGTQRQSVDLYLNDQSAPAYVKMVRVYYSATEFEATSPPLHNGDPFTYWHNTYKLNGYDLGATSAAPFGPRHGYFGVPASGVTGTTFTGFLYEIWLLGGNWQHWFSCTLQTS
jgi:hypothetical protein